MLLEGKKALVMGLANNKSIAWGIAQCLKQHGARLAFNYVGEAIKKRVIPLSEELSGEFTFQCDVCSDTEIADAAALVKEKWGTFDILVHSIAFANKDDLRGQYMNVSRDGFKLAMEVSVFSLPALCKALVPLMPAGSSIITMTYHGSTKVIPGYNIMGVAKAALESSVRYLAYDLGPQGIRVNAISSGPIKTLAASAVISMRDVFQRVQESCPLHRNVTIEDVGKTAVYLASDLANSVTGAVIYTDCGFNQMGVTA